MHPSTDYLKSIAPRCLLTPAFYIWQNIGRTTTSASLVVMNYNRMLTGGAASFPYFNGRLQYIEGVVVSTTVASVHWEMIRSAIFRADWSISERFALPSAHAAVARRFAGAAGRESPGRLPPCEISIEVRCYCGGACVGHHTGRKPALSTRPGLPPAFRSSQHTYGGQRHDDRPF